MRDEVLHYPFLIDQKSVGWLAEKNTPDEKDVERRKSDGDYELAMPAGYVVLSMARSICRMFSFDQCHLVVVVVVVPITDRSRLGVVILITQET